MNVHIIRTIGAEDFELLRRYIIEGYTILAATSIPSPSILSVCVEYVLKKED